MNTPQPLCELLAVDKKFGERRVLTSFDLRVHPGRMVALTGPSGAGKSTALNIVGLLDHPDAGEVRLFQKPAPPPHSSGAQRLLRNRMGYVFQNAALIEGMSVGANVQLAQRYQAGSRSSKRAATRAALESVGLGGFEDRKVYTLSGGEQQRVALARLMASPRDLILADEPTGSLDPVNRDHVLDLLATLRDRGAAILIVTHDPAVVDRADEVVAIRQ